MDLKINYLGLELDGPLMPGACPLSEKLDTVRRLEDAGAAAIVLPSLFEEQIVKEQLAMQESIDGPAQSFGEATSYFPDLPDMKMGPEEYLERIRSTKEAVGIPVIGSLNGSTPGGWLEYAKKIQEAGADAVELNVYYVGRDFAEPGEALEARIVEIAEEVKRAVSIPVAIKLGPFYSSFANMAKRLEETGVDGLVLFNRFYQPDFDIDNLEVVPNLELSTSYELRLRLRWLALLHGRVNTSLAVTGGVHTGIDAVKSVMAGANAVQVVSALLSHGPGHLKKIKDDMTAWMTQHEYESAEQMRGCMSLEGTDDLAALVRSNYMQILKSWT